MHNFFESEPDDILIEIFKNLSFLERIKIARVSKRFNNIAKDGRLALNEKEKSELPRLIFDAVHTEDKEQVKVQLARGANPSQSNACFTNEQWKSYYNYYSPNRRLTESSLLHFATLHGNYKIAAILIKKGADINYQNIYGLTALHYAARAGKAEIAKLLIDSGANINLTGSNNELYPHEKNTPAELAKKNGFNSLAQAIDSNSGWESLLEEKEDVNKPKI
jgi:hypothetical protein